MNFHDISNQSIVASAATDVSNLYATDSSYNFIKAQEGCAYECFWDTAQWSIGYGNKCPYTHTSNGVRGQKGGHTITEEQARQLFDEKISRYVNTLKSNCSGLSMTQNQFDALLSATYNHGNVQNCPLKYYLQGKYTEVQARENYYVWCINAGTADEAGLRTRRKREADLFFSGQELTPRIENPRITQITSTGYIVQCEVYDEVNPVTRVAFPTWTTKTDSSGNDQDDIIWGDGTISGATATFEVRISDHNNELGYYRTHIYCYNTTGASSSVALPDICLENTEPSIYNVRIAAQTSSSYTIQCNVADNDSGIDRVQFPTWTTANGQDDLKADWGTNKSLRGTIDGNTVTYTVSISDHNDEHGEYETHIYAYDRSGNNSSFGIKIIIEDTPPKISNVKIINQTSTSYTIQCKVEDSESGIDRVQFPTWTSSNGQDDIVEEWGSNKFVRGTLKDNIATFTVKIADHNNETGEYNTHIYAYDRCGNYDSYGVKVNLGIYKLTVDPNGGVYDNTTTAVTKEYVLQYGFNYWGDIGKGKYGNATRNGYILTGYYDKPIDGIKIYDSNGIALDTDYFTNHTYFGDSDLTVYAQWKIIRGDVNADNSFTVADVVLLQKWLLAVPTTHLEHWQAADLCEDGKLNVFDLCQMKRILIKEEIV